MSRYDDTGCGCAIYIALTILFIVPTMISGIMEMEEPKKYYIILTSLLVLVLLAMIVGYKHFHDQHKRDTHSYNMRCKELSKCNNENKALQKELDELKKKYENENLKFNNLLYITKHKNPFKYLSELCADLDTAFIDDLEDYYRYKPHPARKKADDVASLKKIMAETLANYKHIKYKYDFLLSVFPELKSYMDEDSSLIHMAEYNDYNSFENERDRVRDWMSDEEYSRLSVTERNQLALDKYKARSKDAWEIGIDYELYIGYLIRESKPPFTGDKFHVEQFGERWGVNDLGRDIIATGVTSGTIYVIQCKRWAKEKVLHENVICQLYGTTIEYQLSAKWSSLFERKIIPLLITTTELSDEAKKFADRLGVMYKIIPMGDYPMIKCNINQATGERIYHLPFDQQYHNTLIKENTGECYAITVKEAEAKGFRRAKRHNI